MCGRFASGRDSDDPAVLFGSIRSGEAVLPSWNIAPTDPSPAPIRAPPRTRVGQRPAAAALHHPTGRGQEVRGGPGRRGRVRPGRPGAVGLRTATRSRQPDLSSDLGRPGPGPVQRSPGTRRCAGWNAGALRAGEAQLLGGAARGSGLGRPVLVLPQPGDGVGQRGQLGEQLPVLAAADEPGRGQQHGRGDPRRRAPARAPSRSPPVDPA